MNNRQLGHFEISIKTVRDNPNQIAKVFALLNMVTTRCECLYHKEVFLYCGICSRFREIPKGETIPQYGLIIGTDSRGFVDLVEVKEI